MSISLMSIFSQLILLYLSTIDIIVFDQIYIQKYTFMKVQVI